MKLERTLHALKSFAFLALTILVSIGAVEGYVRLGLSLWQAWVASLATYFLGIIVYALYSDVREQS